MNQDEELEEIIMIMENYDKTINECFLKYTTEEYNNFNLPKLIKILDICYKSQDPNQHRMGTLLNSIFTQRTKTFIITRRMFGDLLKLDENSKYKNINNADYKLLIKTMLDIEHFEYLRKPKLRKGGVLELNCLLFIEILYELHDDMLKNFQSKKWFEKQKKKTLELYDKDLIKNEEDKKEKKVVNMKEVRKRMNDKLDEQIRSKNG